MKGRFYRMVVFYFIFALAVEIFAIFSTIQIYSDLRFMICVLQGIIVVITFSNMIYDIGYKNKY